MVFQIFLWLLLAIAPTEKGIGFQLTFTDESPSPKPTVALQVEAIPQKTYCQFSSSGYSDISLILDKGEGHVVLLPNRQEQVAYQYDEAGVPFLLTMGIKQLRIDKEFALLQSLLNGKVEQEAGSADQTLEGYACEAIIITTDKGSLTAWVAPTLKGKSAILIQQWQGLPYLQDLAQLWRKLDVYGLPLLVTYTTHDDAIKGRIDLSQLTFSIPLNTFDLSNYTIERG